MKSLFNYIDNLKTTGHFCLGSNAICKFPGEYAIELHVEECLNLSIVAKLKTRKARGLKIETCL